MLKTQIRYSWLIMAPLLALLALACGGGSSDGRQPEGITIQTATGALPTQAPIVLDVAMTPVPQPALANFSAALPTMVSQPSVATPTALSTGIKPATPPPSFAAATPAPAAAAAATTQRLTMDGTSPPTTGRWIDVDVSRYTVRLMNGTEVTRTIGPIAVGRQVDTGVYESTQTGTFRVHNKIAGLQYDAPYKTYISDWVGFDAPRANGFHSLLKDASGNVVDASSGRVSNGCIRVGEAAAVFAYTEIGMIVYVHH